MTTIEIIVDPAGEARLQTRGYAGSSCRDESKLLEQALGAVRSDTPTPEMYQSQQQSQQLRQ
jgi:hypothetical protein